VGRVKTWPGLVDPAGFYLRRAALFRLLVRQAADEGDRAGCELAMRSLVSAYRACELLGVGPEADELLARLSADLDPITA
jgi:hypothetical protein